MTPSSAPSTSISPSIHPLFGVHSPSLSSPYSAAAAAALSPSLAAACGIPFMNPSALYSGGASAPIQTVKSSWEGTLESLAAAASKAAAERAATVSKASMPTLGDVRLPTQPLDRAQVVQETSSPAKKARIDEHQGDLSKGCKESNGFMVAANGSAMTSSLPPSSMVQNKDLKPFAVEDNNNIDFKRVFTLDLFNKINIKY